MEDIWLFKRSEVFLLAWLHKDDEDYVKKQKLGFNWCLHVLSAYIYVYCVCAWCPERPAYGIKLSETGIQSVWEMPCVGTEKNPVSWEEQ